MPSRLLPPPGDFTYRGDRAALWILGIVLVLKLVTGGGAVFNGYEAASSADGFPLDQYTRAGARAVVALFGAIGVTQMLVCGLGAIILLRYRALVPLLLLFFVLEFLARKGVAYFNPVERIPGNFGFWFNWAVFLALCVALGLSLRKCTS
jgi:purine-cytosine permease-like protein